MSAAITGQHVTPLPRKCISVSQREREIRAKRFQLCNSILRGTVSHLFLRYVDHRNIQRFYWPTKQKRTFHYLFLSTATQRRPLIVVQHSLTSSRFIAKPLNKFYSKMNAFRVILQPSGQIRRCDIGNAGRFRPIPANQIVADRIRTAVPRTISTESSAQDLFKPLKNEFGGKLEKPHTAPRVGRATHQNSDIDA